MKGEKLSLALKEVINLSIGEIKALPEEKRCGMLSIELGGSVVPGARVIIVTNDKIDQLPIKLPKEYVKDKKGKFIVAEAPLAVLQTLTEDPEVKHIDKPGPLYPDLDDALPWAGADNVISESVRSQHLGSGNLDGEGVLIGILDSGINYLHPDFCYDNNGSLETIIESIWQSENTQWSRTQINAALASETPQSIVPHLDEASGHGSLVAACAASTGRGTNYKGVAPRASLLIAAPEAYGELETIQSNNGYLNAISWFESKAAELNKPIVINISKGSNAGARDGSLPFEGYLDAVIEANNNMVICKTAGNDGNKKHHAFGNAKIDEENNTQATFEITRRINSFELDIWYGSEDNFTVELINPQGNSTGLIIENPANQNAIYFRDQNGIPDISLNVLTSYESGNQTLNNAKHFHFLLNLREPTNSIPLGQYQVKIRPSGNGLAPNGDYHCWLDWTGFSTSNPIEFLPPYLSNSHTLNAGACGQNTLIVGSWEDDSGEISETSSRGPTRDGRNGVSVVALGNEIVGAGSSRALEFTKEPLLQISTGTSFSCPMVAGIVALIYQEALLLNPNGPLPSHTEIRQRIMDQAWNDEFTGNNTPNAIAGGGKVNALSVINPLGSELVNRILIHTEPEAALVGDPVEIVVKAIDTFHRGVANYTGAIQIELSNIDRGDRILTTINSNFENGIVREIIDIPLEAGHYKINGVIDDLSISGTYILDIYESANSPSFTGISLDPLGRTGSTNSFRYQFLFINSQSFPLFGRLVGIAWKNGDQKRMAGWLDLTLKYGSFSGDFYEGLTEILDDNLSLIDPLQETRLDNFIVKDIYEGGHDSFYDRP